MNTPGNNDCQITDEVLYELDKRWQEYIDNPAASKTWEEVKAAILNKLKRCSYTP